MRFDLFPEETTFVYYDSDIQFYIRDYCAAMFLGDSPDFQVETKDIMNMTKNSLNLPYDYSISTHLRSGESEFILHKMNYWKWDQTGALLNPNQGCSELKYDLVEFSWSALWEPGNDIIYPPLNRDYYIEEGTRFLVQANERFKIGDHRVKLQVKADSTQISISSTKILTFNLEILDCKVNSFEVGTQALSDISLITGIRERFKINSFL